MVDGVNGVSRRIDFCECVWAAVQNLADSAARGLGAPLDLTVTVTAPRRHLCNQSPQHVVTNTLQLVSDSEGCC